MDKSIEGRLSGIQMGGARSGFGGRCLCEMCSVAYIWATMFQELTSMPVLQQYGGQHK